MWLHACYSVMVFSMHGWINEQPSGPRSWLLGPLAALMISNINPILKKKWGKKSELEMSTLITDKQRETSFEKCYKVILLVG